MGHVEVARILVLDGGADVNKARANDGATPLFMAAQGGHVEIVRFLMDGGADVDKARTDDGVMPLIMAAQKGRGP